ncbi:MAG: gliding motility-associated C-terminal domain-containing protein [Flavobacteriales bacterium]|nr:gliding motility-associated C-terminal domain-containing protein [Flavobacteriales bacterium]
MRTEAPLPGKIRSVGLCMTLLGMCVAQAQMPTKCLELERVLADACNNACSGAQEGENEMFRFVVGPLPIALSDLEASWATSNPFLGWVQNGTTASLTAQLNATITNCGWLVEPVNGIIPAGAHVLGITSTNMCVAGNSFAGISDTLHVIFQEMGNTLGHFKNTSNGNNVTNTPTGNNDYRQFILYALSQQCADTLDYNTRNMVNQYGTYGGSYTQNDGSSLVSTWPGAPVVSYVNDGCQAPFTPLTVTIITEPEPMPCGASTTLSATANGNVAEVFWSGGSGSFGTPASPTSTYTLGGTETESATLFFCAVSACGDTVCDQVILLVNGSLSLSILSDGPTTFCTGSSVLLTASGGDNYTWSTGESGSTISASTGGTISVASSNACGTSTAAIELTVNDAPIGTIDGEASICEGSESVLVASGGDTYTWSDGTVGEELSIQASGTYSVTVFTECGSDEASFTVGARPALSPAFTVDDTNGCAPLCVFFTATDALLAELTWSFSDGSTATGANVAHCFGPGEFDVTLTATPGPGDQHCAADTTLLELIASWPAPQASYTVTPDVVSMDAPLATFTSTSSDADSLHWVIGTPEGTEASSTVFQFTFPFAGCFPISLVASNTQGCMDAVQGQLCVEEPFALWVPNSFSPNGDDINDVFGPITSVLSPKYYTLSIYDRWGIPFHTMDDHTAGWDGEGAPDDVYVWKLKFTDPRGNMHERTGHVVLIR